MRKENPEKPRFDFCLPKEVETISRRSLLKSAVSFSAAGCLAKMLGIPPAFGQPSFPPQRKLIWINLSGGWDILESVDPKQTANDGLNLMYDYSAAQNLAGASNVKIGRWLPKLAALGNDAVVVRGIAMGTTSHPAGTLYMDTGILSNAGRVNAASISSIVASESTATIPIIQLTGGSEPLIDRGLLKPISIVRANNLDLYRSMYPTTPELIARRIEMLDYLKLSAASLVAETGANDRLTALSTAEVKIRGQLQNNVGAKLVLSDAELQPYISQLNKNSPYKDAANSFALASKLIRNDLVTTINIGLGGFDTHTGQSQRLSPLMNAVDALVSTLTQQLKDAAKLDSTLIVLWSDFGRTPKVNASNGRDHWPVGGSMLIGGGLKGGRAVGATDDYLRALSINPDTGNIDAAGTQISPFHIGGSVLQLCLGSAYMTYRPYLQSLNVLTQLR